MPPPPPTDAEEWVVTASASQTLFLWQDGLKEEELGPLPVLSERNGPRVQAGLGEGGAVDAGQEVLL